MQINQMIGHARRVVSMSRLRHAFLSQRNGAMRTKAETSKNMKLRRYLNMIMGVRQMTRTTTTMMIRRERSKTNARRYSSQWRR
jgi:hypothetical protein